MIELLPRLFRDKIVIDDNCCWLWTAAKKPEGYGVFTTRAGKVKKTWNAHIFSYEHIVGLVPRGLQLDHLCRIRHCVNPSHLEPVSARTNLLRGNGPTAHKAAQTHCIHGHIFDTENTYTNRNGTRRCKKCSNKSSYASHKRSKERLVHGGCRSQT